LHPVLVHTPCSIGMSHLAEYACCSSVALERPNEITLTFSLHPLVIGAGDKRPGTGTSKAISASQRPSGMLDAALSALESPNAALVGRISRMSAQMEAYKSSGIDLNWATHPPFPLPDSLQAVMHYAIGCLFTMRGAQCCSLSIMVLCVNRFACCALIDVPSSCAPLRSRVEEPDGRSGVALCGHAPSNQQLDDQGQREH
jgi:hypothetical protein